MWLKFSTWFDVGFFGSTFLSAHFILFLIDLPALSIYILYSNCDVSLHSRRIILWCILCGFINLLYLVEIVHTHISIYQLRWVDLPLLFHPLSHSIKFISPMSQFFFPVHYVSGASLPNDIIGFWLKIKMLSVREFERIRDNQKKYGAVFPLSMMLTMQHSMIAQ